MAEVQATIGRDAGLTFLVSAELTYAVIAAACSSPQTTELNAGKRADTLMKWVHVGLVQSVLLLGIGAALSDHPLAVIMGGSMAAGFMYASYWHAKDAGLRSSLPGTEQY
jgi:hypothetical protein